MRVTDLGELAGEVLLFGGPYSNLHALQALRAVAGRRKSAHVICTGDIVAYGAHPADCVAEVRAWGIPVVAGNCESQLAQDAADCGCGFEEGSACSIAAVAWFAHARDALDADARAWMADLPEIIVFTHARRRWAVLHGGATAQNRFLWPTETAAHAQELAALRDVVGQVDGVIAGHCGLAYREIVEGVEWINAGVIGMPPNDGAPETRFVTLSDTSMPLLHTLHYDHEASARAMEAANLTQGYEQALRSGWWPAEDVLPQSLRRAAPSRIRIMRVAEAF